jgi:hypothetical protein
MEMMIIFFMFDVLGLPRLNQAKQILTRMSSHAATFAESTLLKKGHLSDVITFGKMGKQAWDRPNSRPSIAETNAWRTIKTQ